MGQTGAHASLLSRGAICSAFLHKDLWSWGWWSRSGQKNYFLQQPTSNKDGSDLGGGMEGTSRIKMAELAGCSAWLELDWKRLQAVRMPSPDFWMRKFGWVRYR